jgi:hypothetical protein
VYTYRALSDEEAARTRTYREFVRSMLGEKDALKGGMQSRVIYGDDAFIKYVVPINKVKAMTNPAGRPQKDEDERN